MVASSNDSSDLKITAKVDASLLFQMGVLGFVALAPWNFVLAQIAYLDAKFDNHFGAYVPIFYSIAVNLAQLLLIWNGNKFTFAPRFDLGCGLLAVFNILLAVVAMTVGNDNAVDNATLGFGLALTCVFILGFGHALMESSAFGLAALCPQSCMIWVMIGEGIAGLVGWPLQVFLTWALDAGGVDRVDEWNCLLFFCFTSLITLCVVPMFRTWTSKHPYMVEVLKIESSRRTNALPTRQTRRPISSIVKDVFPMAFCAWCAMAVTFTVFPSQIVFWESSDPSNTGFVAQVIYTFQVVDVIGRFLPNVGVTMPQNFLIMFVIARAGFIPLFICTSVYSTVSPFNLDWYRHLQMGFFSLTNGVSCTLSMMSGPAKVPDDKAEQEVAGYTMGFALINGILIGSIFGIITNLGLGQLGPSIAVVVPP